MYNLVLIMLFFSETFLLAKTNLIKSVIVSRTIHSSLPSKIVGGGFSQGLMKSVQISLSLVNTVHLVAEGL
jgi:hypothetical protein